MTREEKVKKLKEKINEEANKNINESIQHLKYLFSKSEDESIDNNMIDICINDIYLYKSILCWVNKDIFCNEEYNLNNSYIVKDKYLDIMLLDSFNFCFNYIMSLFEDCNNIDQETLINIGYSFNDKYIVNNIITVMDEIFYNKDLKKENDENG